MIFGKFTDLSSGFIITVELNFNWLAQSTEQEVADSNPGRTNTQGLKITQKKVLVLICNNEICKPLDFLVFSDEDEKP